MTLRELFDFVSSHWPFDRENYPEFPDDARRQQVFAVRHIMHHQMKAMGRVAEACEAAEHDSEGRFDRKTVLDAAAKMTANALRLAEVMEISPESLTGRVRDLMALSTRGRHE